MELASKPLLKEGKITKKYVNNMIQSVYDNGPYMVIADYLALMHAKPGIGVYDSGMSLLVSKNPVLMEGKPVKIFLILAAKDNNSHLENLQKIMTVFMDEKKFNQILKGTKKEISDLFIRE